MEPKPNACNYCTHFRHPTDEQLRHVDIYFLAPKIICSLSTLNLSMICFHKGPLVLRYALVMRKQYFSHFFKSFFMFTQNLFTCKST